MKIAVYSMLIAVAAAAAGCRKDRPAAETLFLAERTLAYCRPSEIDGFGNVVQPIDFSGPYGSMSEYVESLFASREFADGVADRLASQNGQIVSAEDVETRTHLKQIDIPIPVFKLTVKGRSEDEAEAFAAACVEVLCELDADGVRASEEKAMAQLVNDERKLRRDLARIEEKLSSLDNADAPSPELVAERKGLEQSLSRIDDGRAEVWRYYTKNNPRITPLHPTLGENRQCGSGEVK